MLDPQVSRFWQATLLSGLMDAEGLTACWDAIAPAKREDKEHIDRRLARQAVQVKALTLWQAQQLLAGRSNGRPRLGEASRNDKCGDQKRDARAKDASQAVPGFGGILDVIDSILFCAPVVYCWLN